jgi:23S rRNA (adenine2503-C2)-methyltransferase
MPVNKKYPLEDLIAAAKEYVHKTNRSITFEYILIKGMNDSLKDAHNLVKLLREMNCKVNLIPLNPIKEFDLRAPSQWAIKFFKKKLDKKGITATVRMPRGRDIEAACGQLRSRYEKN